MYEWLTFSTVFRVTPLLSTTRSGIKRASLNKTLVAPHTQAGGGEAGERQPERVRS